MQDTQEPAEGRLAGQMLDRIVGYWISCGVHVAARLGVADHLRDGPMSVEQLAASTGSDAASLHRLLRMLASSGVFRQRPDGRFENTPLSTTLRADVPDSMRGFAIMMVDGYNFSAWGELLSSMRTGEVAFKKLQGQPIFEYLAAHPDKAKEFGESMTSLSRTENPAIAESYDFSGIDLLVDVGGGHGSLMAEILSRTPGMRGIVYDRQEVIEAARNSPILQERGVEGRCEFVAGDFFDSVPRGASYIMKYILHDWDDDRCVRILSNCHRDSDGRGKVLVVDNIVPEGNDPHWSKLLDVNMLLLTGGRERTTGEFSALFERSGLRMGRVAPTACPLSVIEAIPA